MREYVRLGQTIIKRIQGRPVRGDGDVGREKLIEAARTILRSRVTSDISRKAVAEAAGVTPALVSYYFPDKTSLLAAATKPVIGERLDRLNAILDSAKDLQSKFREIVLLFIGFNEDESHLLDHYIDLCRDAETGIAQRQRLTAIYGRMAAFYTEGVEQGAWRHLDPDLVFLALWGMCKAVAQGAAFRFDLSPRADHDSRTTPEAIDAIIDLALNGFQRRA